MKSSFNSSVLKLMLFAAAMAVLINDGGSIIASQYMLGERIAQIGEAAADEFKVSGSRAKAQESAKAAADALEIVLIGFEMTDENKTLTVRVEAPNNRTWVAHRVGALRPYLHPRTDYTKNIR